tara:strand:+ start:595 stop:717 length:123 start_codon:yes stop_codon:yes gene_type:complete
VEIVEIPFLVWVFGLGWFFGLSLAVRQERCFVVTLANYWS